MDIMTPTAERLAKTEHWEAPEVSQAVRRHTYRAKGPFEVLYAQGRISDGCKAAGDKLTRHYLGSLGVRTGNDVGTSYDDLVDYPQTYHSQKLAEMRLIIGHDLQWKALLSFVDETANLQQIGSVWLEIRDKKTSATAGLALVRNSLERLAIHYGMTKAVEVA